MIILINLHYLFKITIILNIILKFTVSRQELLGALFMSAGIYWQQNLFQRMRESRMPKVMTKRGNSESLACVGESFWTRNQWEKINHKFGSQSFQPSENPLGDCVGTN